MILQHWEDETMEKKSSSINILQSAISNIQSMGISSAYYRFQNNKKAEKTYSKMRKNEADIVGQTFAFNPLITIVMPTFNTPTLFLTEAIQSIQSQTYKNWELCIADGSTNNPEVRTLLKQYMKKDSRIKVTFLSKNNGISENTNQALALCNGEYIALMDHDDVLHKDALYYCVYHLNQDHSIDVIYTDEDKMSADSSKYYYPHFKPGFNKELLQATNYISHFFLFKADLLSLCGVFNSAFDGSQDHDFILRITDCAKNIYHIPYVLYHWRVHEQSSAGNGDNKNYTFEAAKNALTNRLTKSYPTAYVKPGKNPGYYTCHYPCPKNPVIHILVHKTKSSLSTENLDFMSTDLDYTLDTFTTIAELNSLLKTPCEYIVVLSNVAHISSSDWLKELISNAARSDIGTVSYQTYYKKHILQYGFSYDSHNLLPLGNQNSIHDPGYFMEYETARNVAVTSFSCFAMKWERVPSDFSFNQDFPPMVSMLDLCFSLENAGYGSIVLPGIQCELNEKDETTTIFLPDTLIKKWNQRINTADSLIPHIF